MKVRWSASAREDVQNIRAYIKRQNPAASKRVGARIRQTADRLAHHPLVGRPGRVPSTRETPTLPYPYVIIYEIDNASGEVWILRVYHMAQDRP